MTSWGVEGGEVPRWLFALQSWEFPPTTLFSPHLWHLWFCGEAEVQGGGDLGGCKAGRPAPSLGCSTSKHTHTPVTQFSSHRPP